jgi:peroxiredoxin
MRTAICRDLTAVVAFAIAAAGCSSKEDFSGNPKYVQAPSEPQGNIYEDPSKIEFRNDVESNSQPDPALVDLVLVDTNGQDKKIKEFSSGKSTVLVVTRGLTSPICPYCSKYTAQLIKSYSQFADRGAEVLLVYPIEAMKDALKLDDFLKKSREILEEPDRTVPFPVLLDVELKAVNHLGIRKDLSKPATYVIDSKGEVRYAYVGETWGDRPSIETILKQLDLLKK